MDVAQTHFDAAHYTLWVLLSTTLACNKDLHYRPKMCTTMPKVCNGQQQNNVWAPPESRQILDRHMGS